MTAQAQAMMAADTPKRGRFISLRLKLLLVFLLLFAVVFAGTFYWFYQFATDKAWERVDDDLKVLLRGSVARIDGDKFAELVKNGKPREDGYTDDPAYWEMAQWLSSVKAFDDRAKLYTFVEGKNEHEIVFIGSSGALNDPPGGAQIKEVWTDDPDDCGDLTANVEALHGNLVIQPGVYTDSFGSWHSGYIPIKDSKGNVVGALGIDFRAEYVEGVQNAVKEGLLIATLVATVVCFVLVSLTSSAFTRPISALTRVAERIGEGDYEQDFSALTKDQFPDEIDTLAQVFEIMVSKVYQREQKLRQEVEKLQIMIDQTKRDQQVSEIVDSDFFQDLRAKANEMRTRAKGKSE